MLAVLSLKLTDRASAQETKAQVNLLRIDLEENDRGWKVGHSRNSTYNSPLVEGDVIVKIAGQNVASVGPLSIAALIEYAQLHNLAARIERGGQETAVSLSRPESAESSNESLRQTALGATFRSVEDTQRIIITEIVPGSPAERAGLRSDDELLAVDAKSIQVLGAAQLAHDLNEAKESVIHLRVRRRDHHIELVVKPAPPDQISKSSILPGFPFPLHRRGEQAPNFTLPTLEGRNISLGDFQGKTVLITFWSTWCPPCLAEADLLEKLSRDLGPRLIVLGLDVHDKPEILRHFLHLKRLSYPVLIAGEFESQIPIIYGLTALPLTVLINPKGFITYLQSGFQPHSPLESQVQSAIAK
jgi:thiol-disulfide isomerase/thioredoxin